MNNEIDVRAEIAEWMLLHGHWGAHRSAVLGQRCSCVSSATNMPKPNCKKCLATGQAYVDYPVKIDRRMITPAITAEVGAGEADEFERIRYYMEYVVPVKRDDFILELELNPTTGDIITPAKIRQAYRIVEPIEDMRDKEGRLEFFQVSVEYVDLR